MGKVLLIWGLFLSTSCSMKAIASDLRDSQGQSATWESFLTSIEPGTILILGESHNFDRHRLAQLKVLGDLRRGGHKIDVGLEFLEYPGQEFVNQYRSGTLAEIDFLKSIHWGGYPFKMYKDQVLFPDLAHGESTWALNAPAALTSRIGKVGLDGLTETEKALLPPDFQLGNDVYKERFLSKVPHELPPGVGEKYFAAQSVWDDTMAWRVSQASQTGTTLVIIVGEFHVQYGGGLPDRIRARLPNAKIKTLSMLNSAEYQKQELDAEILPSPKYGVRADFILIE